MNAPQYSVVVPVYNEKENIRPLIEEISAVMDGLGRPYEIVYVDDFSRDGSLEELHRLQPEFKTLQVIAHRRNCGQSAAVASGFAAARGDVIITLDADRQNDPADIPMMIEQLTDGIDMVCGARKKRQDGRLRIISSRVANAFRNAVTGDRISDTGCGLRAMRRAALAEIPVFNGMHRFLPTLMRLQGFTVKEVLVNHRPRTAGVSKYGVGNRAWRGFVDCFAIRWYKSRCIPARRTRDTAS
ncbi:MAG: glycosyltransferase family 2 protein [Kiritimatiellae bacterium]|nr:glycosyltransferase family 2 protein [Kiritimatiellia bacterium]